MKALILALFSLVSISALADNTVPKTGLVFSESSGFVPREYAFNAVCTIDETGIRYEKNSQPQANGEWGHHESFSRNLSRAKFRRLEKKLRAASKGMINQEPYPCDAGSNGLVGYLDGKEFPILQNVDCDVTYINMSKAAVQLALEVERLCGVLVRFETEI
jgi:hypothetical protein